MSGEVMWQGAILLFCVFFLTVLIECRLVPRLRRFAAQPILEIGPNWHLSKAGTPTLGGLGFILAIFLAIGAIVPFWIVRETLAWERPLFLLSFAFCCGAIGFIDDQKKLFKKQNQGLTAAQKYALQVGLCVVFLLLARRWFGLQTTLRVPFSEVQVEMGLFFYPFATFFLTGVLNALNLTDGVDGLLSSLVGIFSGFLLLVGVSRAEENAFLVGCLLLGAVLGFLCFNAHPAKIFMGDTGSLFFGGVVAGYALLSPSPLAILIACGVFVIEALSVIVQVVCFKLSGGKRVLRMAPLHHHFEKGGWSEERVVFSFSAIGVLFAVLAYFAL